MIPAFLRSLATLCRRLISEGRAVHIAEADAAELEMLAGLFEQHGPVNYHPQTLTIPAGTLKAGDVVRIDARLGKSDVTPADLAHGWLRLSRALLNTGCTDIDMGAVRPTPHASEASTQRAAVCAELSALAPYARFEPELSPEQYREALANFGSGQAEIRPYDPLPLYVQGTSEGARAAWEFIAERLDSWINDFRVRQKIEDVGRVDACTRPVVMRFDLVQRYRRELEAMK